MKDFEQIKLLVKLLKEDNRTPSFQKKMHYRVTLLCLNLVSNYYNTSVVELYEKGRMFELEMQKCFLIFVSFMLNAHM